MESKHDFLTTTIGFSCRPFDEACPELAEGLRMTPCVQYFNSIENRSKTGIAWLTLFQKNSPALFRYPPDMTAIREKAATLKYDM
jgi:hypothetical protein